MQDKDLMERDSIGLFVLFYVLVFHRLIVNGAGLLCGLAQYDE
jgi:hypothetical protein